MPSVAPFNAPLALLVLGALSLLFSLNARFPSGRFGVLSLVSFFAGWLTTELALHHVALQAALALGLMLFGALGAPLGWLGLGLLAISFVILTKLHGRAQLAAQVLDDALAGLESDEAEQGEAPGDLLVQSGALTSEGGLGVGVEPGDAIPSVEQASPAERRAQRAALAKEPLRFLDVLSPLPRRHPDVRVERHLIGAVGRSKLHAHVYFHKDKNPGAPVLVFVHGGGWVTGFKQFQAIPMLHQLAAQGFVCVSLDYRLAPRATFPEPVIDVKRGIAWAKEHAARFGGDARFVALSGNSAGGHLASLAALTFDSPALQPGFEEADTRVDACVVFYGVFDLLNQNRQWRHRWFERLMRYLVMKKSIAEARDQYELMSPITHLRADAPPFFIIHGDVDSLVPSGESHYFAEALRAVSHQPVLYAAIPDAQHAFDVFRSIRGTYAVRAAERFLQFFHERHLDQVRLYPAREAATIRPPWQTYESSTPTTAA
ncbi:MAG: alpha/beta hydrolase [Polyangiaceae bacterium]|nr:alpha/beta hydrolase [Polyangiaceae bacterium]MCW5792635.1 alpha/beta hydrolase [Polyangiaceae bacterium]